MALTDAGGAKEHGVLPALDEAKRGQFLDQVLRGARCELEVVLLQRLDDREGGHSGQRLPASHLPGIPFMSEGMLQEFQEAPVLLGRLAGDGLGPFAHRA